MVWDSVCLFLNDFETLNSEAVQIKRLGAKMIPIYNSLKKLETFCVIKLVANLDTQFGITVTKTYIFRQQQKI